LINSGDYCDQGWSVNRSSIANKLDYQNLNIMRKGASGSKGPLSVGMHVFRRRTLVQVMGCLSLTQSKELHGLGAKKAYPLPPGKQP